MWDSLPFIVIGLIIACIIIDHERLRAPPPEKFNFDKLSKMHPKQYAYARELLEKLQKADANILKVLYEYADSPPMNATEALDLVKSRINRNRSSFMEREFNNSYPSTEELEKLYSSLALALDTELVGSEYNSQNRQKAE